MMLERVCDTRRLDLYTTGKVSRLLAKVTGVKVLWARNSSPSHDGRTKNDISIVKTACYLCKLCYSAVEHIRHNTWRTCRVQLRSHRHVDNDQLILCLE